MTAATRVLVVDDNPLVHQAFDAIFSEIPNGESAALERRLFSESAGEPGVRTYELVSAATGREALDALARANGEGRRFELAFVDVRMPAGWDGIQTTRRLWDVDPSLPVVLCTAYSDHTWTDLRTALGPSDRLLILKKPFDRIEVQQLASALTDRRAANDRVADEASSLREQLQAEQQIRQQTEVELRHAQKLEAIGQLAAGVAHEINTPVQFIGDSLHFLKDSFDDITGLLRFVDAQLARCPAPVADAIRAEMEDVDLEFLLEETPGAFDMSADGVRRVATIVKGLKAFSHHGDEAAPSDVNQAVENAVTVARHAWKLVAKVDLDLGHLPEVHCSLGNINQVLLNLIVNAAHAIEDVVGSSGTLGRIAITTRQEGDAAVITIADSGGGIPEDVRARVFEPFFTTKAIGRGTGQGLAIAYGVVVEGHKGQLTFDTCPTGTTFRVSLPIKGAA